MVQSHEYEGRIMSSESPISPSDTSASRDAVSALPKSTSRALTGPLVGRRYLLTGASRGLGERALRALIKRGASVVAVARNQTQLEALRAELGERVFVAPLDLSEPAEVTRWAETLWADYGPLDGLIHNAGVDDFQPMLTISAEAITRQVNLNLLAPLLINRALLPHLTTCSTQSITNHERVIIHISSVAGLIPTPFGSVYSATKAGLYLYNEALAVELQESPVRFVSLHPGFVHGVGMHEAHKASAGRAPFILGGTTDGAVIKALMRALVRGSGLKIVNRFAVRPLNALFALAPHLVRVALRRLLYPYLKRVVSHTRAPDPLQVPETPQAPQDAHAPQESPER